MAQDEDLLTESFSARRKCFTVFQRITVVSNIVFALFALLLIVLGGVAVKKLNDNSLYVKVTIPAGLIVLGVILLVIILLGVFGSFKKSTKLLAAYFVLLFLFIICEFGVGGGAYAMRDQIPDKAASWWELPDQDKSQQQYSWSCCGWSTIYDNPGSNCWTYNATNPNATTGIVVVPAITSGSGGGGSAKRDDSTTGLQSTTGGKLTWATPCKDMIVNTFYQELSAVGTVGIVFATLQLVALISSIVVFAFIKVEQRRSQDERF